MFYSFKKSTKRRKYEKRFTLIELLVVVLIIGILSAIALPQYTQAVEKSRAAEALSNLGSFSRAVEIWKLGHPDTRRTFTGNSYGVGELDIGIPDDWAQPTEDTRITTDSGFEDKTYSCSKNFCYDINAGYDIVKARRANGGHYTYGIWYYVGTNTYKCEAHTREDYKLCRSLSATYVGEM